MTTAALQRDDQTGSQPRRDYILKISAALFAEKGYQSVGVAEIGDRVGLGRGALYHHIRSKEELLYDIIIDYITDLVTVGTRILAETADPRQRVVRLSRHMMTIIAGNRAEMTVCFRESDCLTGDRHAAVAQLHADYQALWSRVCDEGHREGVFRKLPTVALKGLLGMYFHSFLWMDPKGRSSADEIGDVFADIVLRALAVDASEPQAASPAPRRRGGLRL